MTIRKCMLLALIPQTRWCSKPLPMLNNHVYSLSLACWRKGEHILVSTFNFLLDMTGKYSTVCTTATVEYSLSGIVAGNKCRCVVCNAHVKVSRILKMHGTSKNVPVIFKLHFPLLGTAGAFGYIIKRFSNKKKTKTTQEILRRRPKSVCQWRSSMGSRSLRASIARGWEWSDGIVIQ